MYEPLDGPFADKNSDKKVWYILKAYYHEIEIISDLEGSHAVDTTHKKSCSQCHPEIFTRSKYRVEHNAGLTEIHISGS